MAAFVMVVYTVCTLNVVVVVVVCSVLIFGVCSALVVQLLGVWSMHVAGLLGRPFRSSLAVASATLVNCLELTVVDPFPRLAVATVVIVLAPPAAVVRSVIRKALQLAMVAWLQLMTMFVMG